MKIDLRKLPAIYINMDKDVEKKNDIESYLTVLGFKKIIRVSGPAHNNSRFGCALGHLAAMSQLPPQFIVFEDDCAPLKFQPIINVPDDADAVHLGNMNWSWENWTHGQSLRYEEVDGYNDVYRVYNMLGAHAIVYLTEPYLEACAHGISEAIFKYKHPHDLELANIQPDFNIYSTKKPMFFQVGIHTPNTNKAIHDYPKS